MANNSTTDFLRFSAYSIKDLITRKLSEDSKFTDLIYEGSNLAILIDIVSYMYLCLIYNINNAASESMFSDTLLYENISRLCRFIGYHPQGFKPALMNVTVNRGLILDEDEHKDNVYPCTAFDTGLYDSYGNKIYFSTVFDANVNFGPIDSSNNYINLTMTNGKWKHYTTVFIANGVDYETFVLDGLVSDSSLEKYVANNKIQVFVEQNDGLVVRWDNDPNEIFILAYNSDAFEVPGNDVIFSKLYDEDSRVYTAYLNENRTFEIKFGNGVTGKKLSRGDKVHVMYLDSNGPDGYIDLSLVELTRNAKLEHSPSFFGLSEDLYYKMFNIEKDSNYSISLLDLVRIAIDPDSLTHPAFEEGVEDIRSNAPQWFKTGNRLITKKDYEYFVTSNRGEIFTGVLDAKCMNNWDYLTTFYRWLYNLGLNPIEPAYDGQQSPYRYLQRARLVNAGYEYVDAADANNIYLWIATSNASDIYALKQLLNNLIMQIKTMTSETYPLAPVDVYFDISFTPLQLYYENLAKNSEENGDESLGSIVAFDEQWSYLEVIIADNSIYSTTLVKSTIAQIIENAFSPMSCKLGQVINYDTILDKIYAINGIERVRTVYYPSDYLENSENYSLYKTRACDGIAFASWSSTKLIKAGDDLQINNTSRALEPFLFPRLVPGVDISLKIKIIKKSMNTTSPIKF